MGGMESHCHALTVGLRRAGHDVTLFAAGESDLEDFRSVCPAPYESVLPWALWRGTPELHDYQRNAFERAWSEIIRGGFDIVHNNSLFPDLLLWAMRAGIPMVTSQHVPPYAAMRSAVESVLGDRSQQITVTSSNQLDLWHAGSAPNIRVVHNGVDLSRWQPNSETSDRMIWYGRITANKGLREAVEAARRSGAKLDIVGSVEEEVYFNETVAPFLDGSIRYLGHLSGTELRRKVAGSTHVVITPMWDEPFGLVAAEALACGVPAVAFDRGAMREVIGDCGTLVPAGDITALADAMSKPPLISVDRCRQRARTNFATEVMLANYERCYAAAIEGSTGLVPSLASASSFAKTAALLA